ncbi:MAG: hypothetical protein AB1446_00935 [Bacillota bacterium]
MAWIDWGTVVASLRVMGLGMASIMLAALAFWGAIVVLRRAFPPAPQAPETEHQPQSGHQA